VERGKEKGHGGGKGRGQQPEREALERQPVGTDCDEGETARDGGGGCDGGEAEAI
jgi:hypothetical protein